MFVRWIPSIERRVFEQRALNVHVYILTIDPAQLLNRLCEDKVMRLLVWAGIRRSPKSVTLKGSVLSEIYFNVATLLYS